MKTFSIWGSCVSREIMNYLDGEYSIQGYVMQNPIHTLGYNGIHIDPELIDSNTNFLRRMAELEINKTSMNYFSQWKSDYAIIDVCDCRLGWFESADGGRICKSPTILRTVDKLEKNNELYMHYADEVKYSDWYRYSYDFLEYIQKLYATDKIILNRFEFAEGYIDNKGAYVKYEGFGNIEKLNEITQKVEEIFLEIMNSKCLVIAPYREPLGSYNSHLGLSPLHYCEDVYRCQANKIRELVDI